WRHRLTQLSKLCAVVGGVGILWILGSVGIGRRLRIGARPTACTPPAVNEHHDSLDGHTRGTNVHKTSRPLEGELHAGFDDDRHAPLQMDGLTGFHRMRLADLLVPRLSDLKREVAVHLLLLVSSD